MQFIQVERVTGPVEVQDWRKLDLGKPVPPPACEQEADTGKTVSAPSQHRDGLLLRVQTRCCGHDLICLIDCGASRCYLDSQRVLQLGLHPTAENATLELGDGTKVPSSGCIHDLKFVMGSHTFSQNFTVTNLMRGIDMVLGMTWLESVNPLVNWGSHTLYIRVHDILYPIVGVPADQDTKIGTVRHLETQTNEDQSVQYHSLETMASPQFWEYVRDHQHWRSVPDREPVASRAGNEFTASDDEQSRSSQFCHRIAATPRGVLQRQVRNVLSQRTFISLKQMRKLTQRGEHSFLLMIRSFGKDTTQK